MTRPAAMDTSHSYLLITPVKDERLNLPRLIECVTRQSIKPVLWTIVDDGSTDGSHELIEQAVRRHPWIRKVDRPSGLRDSWLHYSVVVKDGLTYALTALTKDHSPFEFLGLLDADITVDPDYYRDLMFRFERIPGLGVASGGLYFRRQHRLIWERTTSNWPTGGAMLIRKSCFHKVGYEVGRAADSVFFIRSMMNGFETRQFPELKAVQSRPTYTGGGYWRGYMDFGRTRYYLGYSPLFVLLYTIKLLCTFPFLHGAAFLLGYLTDTLKRRERIGDPTIRLFYQHRVKAKIRELLSDWTAHKGGRNPAAAVR